MVENGGNMNKNNDNGCDNKGAANERRIDHIVNLVEKQTRTERHLEEHSDISSSEANLEHARHLQMERQNEIDNLKNIVANGENVNNDYKVNTEKRFRYTEGYLNNNSDRMDNKSFQNAKVKQEHRKEQMDSMQ